jgi:hypothetical protein
MGHGQEDAATDTDTVMVTDNINTIALRKLEGQAMPGRHGTVHRPWAMGHGQEDTATDTATVMVTDNMNTIAFPSKEANACPSLERSDVHFANEVVLAIADVVRIGRALSTHALHACMMQAGVHHCQLLQNQATPRHATPGQATFGGQFAFRHGLLRTSRP